MIFLLIKLLKIMLVGLVGKPSSGKTTLLNAMTMSDAKVGNYPFTTIKPNRGLAYVRIQCPCGELENDCNPNSGWCNNGTRFIPIEILDVAGLVPGAAAGKGMGNQFLDDLRQAAAFIHVVDLAGNTDAEGNPIDSYNPVNDIKWLNEELNAWVSSITFRDWDKLARKLDADRTKTVETITEKLSGLGADVTTTKSALRNVDLLEKNPKKWDDNDKDKFARAMRDKLFPLIIAANKNDTQNADLNLINLKTEFPDVDIIPTSGLAELTLRKAEDKGWIKYQPGDSGFTKIPNIENQKFEKTLDQIQKRLLGEGKSTGVAQLLQKVAFEILKYIIVFPVEDPTHLTDKEDKILPDVHLVPRGTTAKSFAGMIHTDFADTFIHAILVNRSNKRISANHELNYGDIVKIVTAVK